MPQIFAGLGLLGLGVVTVVAFATLLFSVFENPDHIVPVQDTPRNYCQNYDRRRRQGRDTNCTNRRDTISTNRRDTICTICLDSLVSNVIDLRCGHAFHEQCIETWSSSGQANCPLCRKNI